MWFQGSSDAHVRLRHHLLMIALIIRMMHNIEMRTTITLDDETHEFAAYYARAKGLSLSQAIDELIRKAQDARGSEPDIRRGPNGFPMFPPSNSGEILTTEMVKKLDEEDFDAKKFA